MNKIILIICNAIMFFMGWYWTHSYEWSYWCGVGIALLVCALYIMNKDNK